MRTKATLVSWTLNCKSVVYVPLLWAVAHVISLAATLTSMSLPPVTATVPTQLLAASYEGTVKSGLQEPSREMATGSRSGKSHVTTKLYLRNQGNIRNMSDHDRVPPHTLHGGCYFKDRHSRSHLYIAKDRVLPRYHGERGKQRRVWCQEASSEVSRTCQCWCPT